MDAALLIISDEHRAFDAALAAVIDRVRLVRAHRAEADSGSFKRGISFLATFMDHFHHPKEDKYLFKAVKARSGEAGDLIEHLEHDHARAPGIFAELLKSLDGTPAGSEARFEDFAQLMERYGQSQVEHMRLENEQLIPIARRVLHLSDWKAIGAALAANRDPLFVATGASVFSASSLRNPIR